MTNLDVKFSKYLQFDAEIITSKVINSLFVNRELKKLLQNTEIENNWLLLHVSTTVVSGYMYMYITWMSM